MRPFKAASIFLALAFVAPVAMAQDQSQTHDLAAMVDEVFAANEAVALGAAIIDVNGVVELAVAGTRASGSDVLVTVDDLWHIGSDTKAMTATLLARLDAQGVLDLDATLVSLLPDLADDMHDGYGQATLPQLLTHGTGVAPNPGLVRMFQYRASSRPMPEQRLEIARRALGQEPAFTPGTGYQYSNIGYMIAGVIAETQTGQAWEDLIAAELFTPLGMSSAGFGAPGTEDEMDQPRGHTSFIMGKSISGVGRSGDNPLAFGPAGTVHLSLEDWARFGAEQLRGAQGTSDYLSADLFEQLHTPLSNDESYAMGWGVARVETATGMQTSLRHAGSNTMWFAFIDLRVEPGLGILVVTNDGTEDGQAAARDLTLRLRAEVFGEE